MINKLLLSLVFLFVSLPEDFTGKVKFVSDGDTIGVIHNEGEPERIRLYGIDCPEISHKPKEASQSFGQTAKNFTKDLIGDSEVKIIDKGKDKYGRTIGIVVLPDGKILNEELLKAGLAWHYKQYDSNQEWQKMEDEAKAAGKGLWADKNCVAPWTWRHEKMAEAK